MVSVIRYPAAFGIEPISLPTIDAKAPNANIWEKLHIFKKTCSYRKSLDRKELRISPHNAGNSPCHNLSCGAGFGENQLAPLWRMVSQKIKRVTNQRSRNILPSIKYWHLCCRCSLFLNFEWSEIHSVGLLRSNSPWLGNYHHIAFRRMLWIFFGAFTIRILRIRRMLHAIEKQFNVERLKKAADVGFAEKMAQKVLKKKDIPEEEKESAASKELRIYWKIEFENVGSEDAIHAPQNFMWAISMKDITPAGLMPTINKLVSLIAAAAAVEIARKGARHN